MVSNFLEPNDDKLISLNRFFPNKLFGWIGSLSVYNVSSAFLAIRVSISRYESLRSAKTSSRGIRMLKWVFPFTATKDVGRYGT